MKLLRSYAEGEGRRQGEFAAKGELGVNEAIYVCNTRRCERAW